MNAGVMYFKLVTRKLQGSNKNYQFLILAGATSKLSHSTADFIETLSPNSTLTRAEIEKLVERLRKLGSYGTVASITQPDVEKKLAKLFGEGETPTEGPAEAGFEGMGIGQYIQQV